MSAYYEDEYYDDYYDSDDWYDDNTEYSYTEYLCRASNGHLYIERVTGVKPPRHDWGEGYFYSDNFRLSDLSDEWREACIRVGRDMQNSSSEYLSYAWLDDECEE